MDGVSGTEPVFTAIAIVARERRLRAAGMIRIDDLHHLGDDVPSLFDQHAVPRAQRRQVVRPCGQLLDQQVLQGGGGRELEQPYVTADPDEADAMISREPDELRQIGAGHGREVQPGDGRPPGVVVRPRLRDELHALRRDPGRGGRM